jgi:hypothetical protein
MPPKRALLIVFGASGVGKTTAVRRLESRQLPGVRCYYFDSIGVPSEGVMARDFGGPEAWQEGATRRWLARLAGELAPGEVGVLEGQTRPSFINAAAAAHPELVMAVVMYDSSSEVRAARLAERGQPDLHTPQMDDWAAYLRREADKLGWAVIDTSRIDAEQAAERLEAAVVVLQAVAAAAVVSTES